LTIRKCVIIFLELFIPLYLQHIRALFLKLAL